MNPDSFLAPASRLRSSRFRDRASSALRPLLGIDGQLARNVGRVERVPVLSDTYRGARGGRHPPLPLGEPTLRTTLRRRYAARAQASLLSDESASAESQARGTTTEEVPTGSARGSDWDRCDLRIGLAIGQLGVPRPSPEPIRPTDVAAAPRPDREAGEIRLLRLELSLRQHARRLQLPQVLQTLERVVLRRCGGRLRLVRVVLIGGTLFPQRLAWRRDTRLDTAVAVPATTAVLATPLSNPGMVSPSFRSFELRPGPLSSSRAEMSAFTRILPVATSCAPLCRSAVANGAAHVFSYTIGAAEQPGSIASAPHGRRRRATQTKPFEDRELRIPSTAKSWRSRPTIVPSVPSSRRPGRAPGSARGRRDARGGNASPVGCLSAAIRRRRSRWAGAQRPYRSRLPPRTHAAAAVRRIREPSGTDAHHTAASAPRFDPSVVRSTSDAVERCARCRTDARGP